MPKGKRRAGYIVNPGGVSYPTRRQARRVARLAGGTVEGRGSFLPWALVLLGVLAVVALAFGIVNA